MPSSERVGAYASNWVLFSIRITYLSTYVHDFSSSGLTRLPHTVQEDLDQCVSYVQKKSRTNQKRTNQVFTKRTDKIPHYCKDHKVKIALIKEFWIIFAIALFQDSH